MFGIACILLVALQLSCGANPRSENGLGGDLPDVKSLPCDQPGCKKGVKGKILAFSALHDVTLKEVALFVDIAFDDDPDERAVECLFWSESHEGKQPVKVDGKAVRIFDNKHTYAPYAVKCQDPVPLLKTMPVWAGLAIDRKDTEVRLLVEKIGLQQKGTVGACNGVINSDRFDLTYEWLHYYTKLGVEGFTIYITRKEVQWNDKPIIAVADPDTMTPFSFPGVSWMQFQHLTIEDRFLFSQTTIYNDCVYRLRHEYKYLLMFDIDEYLVLRDSRYTKEGGLKSFLHYSFPPHHAALGVYRYAYRDDCGKEEPVKTDVFHERFTHRLKDPESKTVLRSNRFADKLIIKPDRVDIFYMHFLGSARSPYLINTMNTQPSIVFLKHLRRYDENCEELTEELPFDQE